MSTVFSLRSGVLPGKELLAGLEPVGVHFSPGKPTKIAFQNQRMSDSSCLRCYDAPCMSYRNEEVLVTSALGFPTDRNPDVCASGALLRPNGAGAPIVNVGDCIGCGVCVTRCPVGAIHLAPHAVVADAPNAAFFETEAQDTKAMLRTRAKFEAAHRNGSMIDETDQIVDGLQRKLEQSARRIGDRFPNHFVRNLFLALGVQAAMRRRGDNSVRMDLIFGAPEIGLGVAEIEFGKDAVLDSPRDILDDVAVLVSRHNWPRANTIAVIVSDVLPNNRSEYWEIIRDIRKVTSLGIDTITVFALVLLVWTGRKLTSQLGTDFYVDKDTDSYRTRVLEAILQRPLNLSWAPRSHVEVAK